MGYLSCCLEVIQALTILITVILESLSDNFNVDVISESGSDADFLSSDSFSLSVDTPHNVLLKAGHILSCNRNEVNTPLVLDWA